MNAKTILVADDSPLILRILRIKLEAAGYEVLTAAEPSDAFEIVREKHPDVIIMDINFPPDVGFGGGGAWDGFRMLQWMKLNHSAGTAVEIIITNDNLDKHRAEADKAGVSGLFRKPIDMDALLKTIEAASAERAAAQTSVASNADQATQAALK